MVFPPNGQYILLCSPVSVILCAFWLSARHDLLAGLDQEFSSLARARNGGQIPADPLKNYRRSRPLRSVSLPIESLNRGLSIVGPQLTRLTTKFARNKVEGTLYGCSLSYTHSLIRTITKSSCFYIVKVT